TCWPFPSKAWPPATAQPCCASSAPVWPMSMSIRKTSPTGKFAARYVKAAHDTTGQGKPNTRRPDTGWRNAAIEERGTRQGQTQQSQLRQAQIQQGETRQDRRRQGPRRQGQTRQSQTRQGQTRQSQTRQSQTRSAEPARPAGTFGNGPDTKEARARFGPGASGPR